MEKLTHAVTVKFCERSAADLQSLAAARGMEVSEYIRDLVSQDRLRAKVQFDALKSIFLQDGQLGQGNEG
jgi:hypothetical protein